MDSSQPTDTQIQKRTTKGWLQPYLIAIDAMFAKRWVYWFQTVSAGKVLDEPIPHINWLSTPHNEPMKNLLTCLALCHGHSSWEAFSHFIDWLLYGLGDPSVKEFPTAISKPLNAGW